MKPWVVVQLGEVLDSEKNTVTSEHDTKDEADQAIADQHKRLHGLDIMGHCPKWIAAEVKIEQRT